MVKGVTRRVILVKSPDRRLFEQAIFIVREGAFNTEGVTAQQVLAEAQRVADGYVRRNTPFGKLLQHIGAPVYAILGALAASLVWCVVLFF